MPRPDNVQLTVSHGHGGGAAGYTGVVAAGQSMADPYFKTRRQWPGRHESATARLVVDAYRSLTGTFIWGASPRERPGRGTVTHSLHLPGLRKPHATAAQRRHPAPAKPCSRWCEHYYRWGGWDSNPRPTDYESAALTG